ncbi:Rgg family transcriptional regulator [Carnobacterium gallinarum]|uniref:helix-turn-helix domain-containing protein n=1 Tax=Carnobacterium gallinarum TaxID=2749 RepID=UPI00054E75F4|nr:Rgg/GadR/MutR family transcriptional regulator [Carnobacterium gallinarum]
MDIGNTLKRIREAKNFTQKEISEGILSLSFYNKIENGKNSLTVQLFFEILNRLNVDFDEFFFIHNNYTKNIYDNYWYKIYDFYYLSDSIGLEKLIESLALDYQNTKNITLNHLLHLAHIVNCRIKNILPDEKVIEEICTYLLSIESWTKYEIRLFISIMDVFDFELLLILSRKILSRLRNYSKNQEYAHFMNDALINLIIICLESGKINDSLYFLNLLKSQRLDGKHLYEKNIVNFLEGIYLLSLGDKKGEEKANKTIEIFEYLEMKDHAKKYKIFLDKMKNERVQN